MVNRYEVNGGKYKHHQDEEVEIDRVKRFNATDTVVYDIAKKLNDCSKCLRRDLELSISSSRVLNNSAFQDQDMLEYELSVMLIEQLDKSIKLANNIGRALANFKDAREFPSGYNSEKLMERIINDRKKRNKK